MPEDDIFATGDFVVDVEDTDPDVAVVIKLPNTTISQWVVDPDTDADHTVADENPNYDPETPVVLVAFVETGLEERWSDWRQHIDDDLYTGVIDNGVKFYPFPMERLQPAKPAEIAQAI